MELFTSCYSAGSLIVAKNVAPIRISIGAPRFRTPYRLAGACRLLMPSRDMLGLTYDDYAPAYEGILDGHGVDAIRADLESLFQEAGRRPLALLCFEKLGDDDIWCHRRMFADWWERRTGQCVMELGVR